jgi:hypothetical protein
MSNDILTDDVACFLPLGGLGITVSHSGPFVSSSLGNPNSSSEMLTTCGLVEVIATWLVRTNVEVDQVEPMVRDGIEQMLEGLLDFLERGSPATETLMAHESMSPAVFGLLVSISDR